MTKVPLTSPQEPKRKLDRIPTPFYVRRIAGVNVGFYLAIIQLLIGGIIARLEPQTKLLPNFAGILLISASMYPVGFLALSAAYRFLLNTFREISDQMHVEERALTHIQSTVAAVFRARNLVFSAAAALPFVFLQERLFHEAHVSPVILIFFLITGALCCSIIGLGVWTAIATLRLLRHLVSFAEQSQFALAPNRSAAILLISHLFTRLATLFAVVHVPYIIGSFIFLSSADVANVFHPQKGDLLAMVYVLIGFTLFLLYYAISPQLFLTRHVRTTRRRLQFAVQKLLNSSIKSFSPPASFSTWRELEESLSACSDYPANLLRIIPALTLLGSSLATLLVKGLQVDRVFQAILKNIWVP